MRASAIFPGQGSQVVGMGVEIARASPAARAVFECANRVLGYDVLALQENGPEERLRETVFSQPAIFTTNVALYAASSDLLEPIASAGHSFGELCSLTIAGALSLEAAVSIVDARAHAMQHAAQMAPGAMAAILGIDAPAIRAVVEETTRESGAEVQLANFNAPSQIVISGDREAVNRACEALLEAGAKRVVPLNVSGAWHSRLMEPAVAPFERAVNAAAIHMPAFDVVSNVDARVYRDVKGIRSNLVRSITSEVRWHDAALQLLSYDLDLVVEFGATPVLAPLFRRLPQAPAVVNVSDSAGIEKLKGALHQGMRAAT